MQKRFEELNRKVGGQLLYYEGMSRLLLLGRPTKQSDMDAGEQHGRQGPSVLFCYLWSK